MGKPKKAKFFLTLKREVLDKLKEALKKRRNLADRISKRERLLKQDKEKKEVFDKEVLSVLESDINSLSNLIKSEKEKKGYRFEIRGWKVRDDSFHDEIYVDFQIIATLVFPGPVPEKHVTGGFEKTIKLKKIQDEIQFLNKRYETEFIIDYEVKRH